MFHASPGVINNSQQRIMDDPTGDLTFLDGGLLCSDALPEAPIDHQKKDNMEAKKKKHNPDCQDLNNYSASTPMQN